MNIKELRKKSHKIIEEQVRMSEYSVRSPKEFSQWLRSLNFIRNISAHHGRLWNINIVERSASPNFIPVKLNNQRPFLYFCIMQKLLNRICPNSTWGQRLINLLETNFPRISNNAISLKDFGITDDWMGYEIWSKGE